MYLQIKGTGSREEGIKNKSKEDHVWIKVLKEVDKEKIRSTSEGG